MRKIENVIIVLVAVLVAGFVWTAVSDPLDLKSDKDGAKKVLHQKGYTDIQWLKYSPMSCTRGEWYTNHFKATLGNETIEGFVCQTITGSAIIRTKYD